MWWSLLAAGTAPDNQTRLFFDLAAAVVPQGAPIVNGWQAGNVVQPGKRCSFATGRAVLRLNRRREIV